MVNYKRALESIEREKRELKKAKTFVPSRLSPSKKKSIKYEYGERIGELSKKEKALKEKKEETDKFRKKVGKLIDKAAKTKMKSRRVLKEAKVEVRMKGYKAPSILGDENRFFSGEMEEAKKSMFFT